MSAGHDVAGVYTQPPRPAGRGMEDKKSPVHVFADEAAIPVFTPKTLRRAEVQEEFEALAPDVAVVAAYGLILPKPVLDAPPLGCLNLHASLLPRWRGAAPIQRAIMAGDRETGVMIMKMEEGLDTGPIALTDRLLIGQDATGGEIHDQLSLMGASLMLTALAMLKAGELVFTRQPEEGATYAPKISKEEARIDWTKPARRCTTTSGRCRHIRGRGSRRCLAEKPKGSRCCARYSCRAEAIRACFWMQT